MAYYGESSSGTMDDKIGHITNNVSSKTDIEQHEENVKHLFASVLMGVIVGGPWGANPKLTVTELVYINMALGWLFSWV